MKFDRLRGSSSLSAHAAQKIARDMRRREEMQIETRFKRFLDREGIRGDERSLALGEIDLEEFKERLMRFFGLGLSLAAAALLLFSLTSIFGVQPLSKPESLRSDHPLEAQDLRENSTNFSYVGRPQP